MNRGLAVLILAGAPALATAGRKPTRLTMKRVEGTNLHIANGEGAIHWQADITIEVELRDQHQLAVTSKGTRGEHNLYAGRSGASYTTDDDTAWTATWSGTWATTKDGLRLDLVLASRTCKDTLTSSGAAPEDRPCKPAAPRTTMTCTSEDVKVTDLATNRSQAVPAWRCTARDSTDLAETPAQWVLGKTACIQTVGGRMSADGFQPCPP